MPSWNLQNCVFGLACYRQISSDQLLIKSADVTRSMVQKAVVVLATQPILGSVRSKLGLVTQAFFAQKDFTKLDILQDLYDNLVSSFKAYPSDSVIFMGISLREMIHRFKHKLLILFKCFLLEKRVHILYESFLRFYSLDKK